MRHIDNDLFLEEKEMLYFSILELEHQMNAYKQKKVTMAKTTYINEIMV